MSKFALFDFAGTLAELVPSRVDVVRNYISSSAGICIEEKHVKYAYQTVEMLYPYSSVSIRSLREKKEFYDVFNRKLLECLGVSHLVDPDGIYDAFVNSKAHWCLKTGVYKTLVELKALGWRIGVISNFDSNLEELVCNELGLVQIVDYFHVSQVEGDEKPNVSFYRSFLDRHGIGVDDAVYIGDSYVLDFLPARELGLRAWLVDEDGFYTHMLESISCIGELPSCLSTGITT